MKKALVVAGAVVSVAAALAVTRHLRVGRVVSSVLAEDSRNSRFTLEGSYCSLVSYDCLRLDVVSADHASPIDLWRGLFQVAGAMQSRNRAFESVQLAHSSEVVFTLSGDDFEAIGRQYTGSENTMYMLRTLPEKLRTPDGAQAFGSWQGGALGVLTKQMEDVNTAARRWALDP